MSIEDELSNIPAGPIRELAQQAVWDVVNFFTEKRPAMCDAILAKETSLEDGEKLKFSVSGSFAVNLDTNFVETTFSFSERTKWTNKTQLKDPNQSELPFNESPQP